MFIGYLKLGSPKRRFTNKWIVFVITKMKFLLQYDKPKQKGYYSTQKATFYDINDAIWWEKVILERGGKNSRIIPVD